MSPFLQPRSTNPGIPRDCFARLIVKIISQFMHSDSYRQDWSRTIFLFFHTPRLRFLLINIFIFNSLWAIPTAHLAFAVCGRQTAFILASAYRSDSQPVSVCVEFPLAERPRRAQLGGLGAT